MHRITFFGFKNVRLSYQYLVKLTVPCQRNILMYILIKRTIPT